MQHLRTYLDMKGLKRAPLYDQCWTKKQPHSDKKMDRIKRSMRRTVRVQQLEVDEELREKAKRASLSP